DQFEILEGLRQNRIDRLRDISLPVIDRDTNAHVRSVLIHCHLKSSSDPSWNFIRGFLISRQTLVLFSPRPSQPSQPLPPRPPPAPNRNPERDADPRPSRSQLSSRASAKAPGP